jgi:ribosomal protein S18 acetylase RimI-like enzyme
MEGFAMKNAIDIKIIKAENKHLLDCKIALLKSELGRVYFPSEDNAVKSLNKGISNGEVFAAVNNEGECLGFVWYILEGAFHRYPYLHIIAVKEEYRGLGIGRKLLEFVEDMTSNDYSKLFLVVADFNPRAKKLYQSIGYKEVGVIPGLYKEGVTEHLMMKEI